MTNWRGMTPFILLATLLVGCGQTGFTTQQEAVADIAPVASPQILVSVDAGVGTVAFVDGKPGVGYTYLLRQGPHGWYSGLGGGGSLYPIGNGCITWGGGGVQDMHFRWDYGHIIDDRVVRVTIEAHGITGEATVKGDAYLSVIEGVPNLDVENVTAYDAQGVILCQQVY